MFMSRGSADQAIITDMTVLGAERGGAVAVALVSSDRGFATALRFCRGHGCPTVCISAMGVPKRLLRPTSQYEHIAFAAGISKPHTRVVVTMFPMRNAC